ncbi:MAG TPA: hypothetical protein VLZ75_07535 [Chitinophagales bacterium]|nr:hypothetical protein [Chitinophagales bacterium]
MITSLIGKKFLEAYNNKHAKKYTAKEFFEEKYFELFFNHSKYMQWVTNSPFVQMKGKQKVHLLTNLERKEKLESLFEKIENETPDASFALGYSASEVKEYASTSGLVSDIIIKSNEEEIFLSWIGSGLGIGVAGGFTILINNPKVLLETYDGWKYYRKYLNEPSLEKLRGNQINSWNGQWLTYKLGKDYRENFDFAELTKQKIFKVDEKLAEVETVNWSNLFFSLSRLFPDDILNSYIYSFGQTNKTIGFIPIYLKSGKTLKDVFKKLYPTENSFEKIEFQSLFGMHIKRACELGSIGLNALRPNSLKKYMEGDNNLSFKNEDDNLIYQSYKTWLIAMISKNKEEIKDYTLELAYLIQKYRSGAKGTDRKNLIEKDLLGAKSKKGFIDALADMINGVDKGDLSAIKNLKDEVHLMTNEEFGYFNTLLKFDYAFVEKQA